VLLAIDAHPHRPGLNHPLRGLQNHFIHVNDNSDLATFRWDLVDPGGPGIVARPVTDQLITMQSRVEEQNHAAQNLPARSPIRPVQGGLSPSHFYQPFVPGAHTAGTSSAGGFDGHLTITLKLKEACPLESYVQAADLLFQDHNCKAFCQQGRD